MSRGFKKARTRVVVRRRDKVRRPKVLPGTEAWEHRIEALASTALTADELFERMETAEPHRGLVRSKG